MISKKYSIATITSIFTVLFIFSCNTQNKWNLKQREFEKEESFNYSEYISGELDSTAKTELEQSREIVQQKPKNLPTQKSKELSIFQKVWKGIKDLYQDFIDFF